ncbi:MAG: putative nucleotidyltransferase substrate binding domain-containing protein, partial [Actinomycetota bacterium]
MDVATFLARHPPFDALVPEALAQVAKAVEIEHFAAGTVILEQSGEPARFLYVIRKGAVELLTEGRLYDLLSEGDVFGQFSLLDGESPTATCRAHEDTLCYLIGADVADEVLGTSAGRTFVLGTMRERLLAGYEAVEPPGIPYRPVGGLIHRTAIEADAGMTVADAAERMAAERVSCLLVPMRGAWGIITDRDLRSRVLAVHRSADTPVEEIASFPMKTLPEDALAGEALLAMFAEGVHHFPVTRPDGTIAGVVTPTDLMDVGRHTPFSIRSAIERARTSDEVVAAGRELPQVVCALVDASSEPVGVGRVIALVVDAMTTRLLSLGIERFGEPPVPWAWLALGSAARHEQALHTDQDHALAYDPQGRPVEDVDPCFAELAEFVTAGLEDAGIPRCKGDAMASNQAMRRSVQGWVDAFRGWMRDPGRSGSILSSIVYDFRKVAGPLDPEPELEQVMREAQHDDAFLRHLVRRALDARPPTGFIRNLVVERKGEHVGRLDVKHGGVTIVGNIARVEAIRAGVAARGTLDRLRGAEDAGTMIAGSASELREAFRYLWEVRLRHQVTQVRAGAAPDDFVDPSTLGPVTRRGLKEAFNVIART